MIPILICCGVAVFGVIYAIYPAWFLKRKMDEKNITPSMLRTAQGVGVVIVILCIIAILLNLGTFQ